MHLSRRHLLGLGAVGALSLAGCSINDRRASVIVIGAGMSGLAAARYLTDRGHDVTVVEARDRIGGRVWTSDVLGFPLDLGASWIHGTTNNPLTTLAAEAGARTVETDPDDTRYFVPGGPAADEVVDTLDTYFELAADVVRDYQDNADDDASLADVLLAAADDEDADPALAAYVINEFEHEYAGSARRLSTFWFDDESAFDGPDVLFPGGYGQLTDRLARGLNIRTNTVVASVTYADDRVTVTTDSGTVTADHAIVTVPLGVLKSGGPQFIPPLPGRTRRAIKELDMGVLNKCYLQFPAQFWPDADWLGYLAPADQPGQWAQWVDLARPTGQPVLLGFNAGDVGAQIENLSDDEQIASAMAALRSMFGPDIPDPTRYWITRWNSDLFALGSYSFIPVGSTPTRRDDLAQPVGRLHFAGEATHRRYPATVHGAYLSGLRAAKEI